MPAAPRAASACRRSEAGAAPSWRRAPPRWLTRPRAHLAVSRVDAVVGRLVHAQDFERLMKTPARKRSAHFAVHHVSACPHQPRRVAAPSAPELLSTGHQPSCPEPVDESGVFAVPGGCWVGYVVPKRHVRRSVMRNLIKRQMRSAAQRHATQLMPGLWLLRQHRPFDAQQFVSAASDRLKAAARQELDTLLAGLSQAATGRPT